MGGGQYAPRAFPNTRLQQLTPSFPPPSTSFYPPQESSTPHPMYAPYSNQISAKSTLQHSIVPLHAPPAPIPSSVLPSEKGLASLLDPMPGSKYFADLPAVKITAISDPFGDGKKLNLIFWDGTGPRANSTTVSRDSIAELVHATCWEAAQSRMLLEFGVSAWIELKNIRVQHNKYRPTEIEIHINNLSKIRRLTVADPVVANLVQNFALKEQRAGISHENSPSLSQQGDKILCVCGFWMPQLSQVCSMCNRPSPGSEPTLLSGRGTAAPSAAAGGDKWKCSSCGVLTFNSKRKCYGCGKTFNALQDGANHLNQVVKAPNVPPPLDSAPKKRIRQLGILTEVVGVHDSLMLHNERTNDFVPKITHLSIVQSSSQRNARYVIECRVQRIYPQERRNCTLPFCYACKNVIEAPNLDQVTECGICGSSLTRDEIQYRYTVAFEVKEHVGPLTLLLVGTSASLFFRSLPACDLWANHQTHQLLAEKLDVLLHAKAVRFAVETYYPTGSSKRHYQIFNTILL